MAQQVKFHSVDAASYADITTPDNGSLYFISDNGEIRKGSAHITGSRVFTATDSTGKTALKFLDIKIDDESIGTPATPAVKHIVTKDEAGKGDYEDKAEGDEVIVTEETAYQPLEGKEQPKRGDILVVNGVGGLSSYVYNKNGDKYDPANWLACSTGTVDASNIVITEDMTLAGAFTSVGNLNNGDTVTAGTTFNDVLKQMFVKKLDDATVTNPSFSVSGSFSQVEIGSTVPAKTLTGTWSDGSYTYGAYVSDGVTQAATGAKVGTWTITAYNGKTAADATISGNTASITTDAWYADTLGTKTMATFNVTNDVTDVLPAATNLKTQTEVASKKITKTNNSASSKTVKVVSYAFWKYVETSYTDAPASSEFRSATAGVKWTKHSKEDTPPTSLSMPSGNRQLLVAIPQAWGKTAVTASHNNGAIPDTMIKLYSVKVPGADNDVDKDGAMMYDVWAITSTDPTGADNTYGFSWS